MKKKTIKRCAWLLAVITVVSALAFGHDAAYGAGGIETGKKDCSLSFQLPESGAIESGGQTVDQVKDTFSQYYDALRELLDGGKITLNVELYKVADVTVSGRYVARDPFAPLGTGIRYQVLEADGVGKIVFEGDEGYDESVEGRPASLEKVNSQTIAEEWEALSRKAYALKSGTPEKTATFVRSDAMEITGLETGMYLVCVGQVKDEQYFYDFVPFLVSLPGNYYGRPAGAANPIEDDTWVYDVTVGLKPDRMDRYGTLVIQKQLRNFNQLEDVKCGGTFIFDVKAEKEGFAGYSNVVSLDFDEFGTGVKSVTIGPDREKAAASPDSYYFAQIPAGSKVTVTERYGGSSYQIVGAASQVIGAEGDPTSFFYADDEKEVNQVTFVNEYDGRLNNGASVINRYQTGEWEKQEKQQ